MEKLVNKILSMRGPEYRPFAIEVCADEIRLAVYGGAKGFDEAATCETASHSDFESCLIEGIDLLEQARLFSPSRAPYHRLPHQQCLFLLKLEGNGESALVQRRHLMRQVPRKGDKVTFGDRKLSVSEVTWQLHLDEVHVYLTRISVSNPQAQRQAWSDRGWDLRTMIHPSPSSES